MFCNSTNSNTYDDSSTNIYVLKLVDNRYYIGKSKNVESRYKKHCDGYGSAWTSTYRPIAIEKIIYNVSAFDEDKITKEYMCEYGIDNVRGGSYVEVELSKEHRDSIIREIRTAKNLCFRCGEPGHFIQFCCYQSHDVLHSNLAKKGNVDDDDDDDDDDSAVSDSISTFKNLTISCQKPDETLGHDTSSSSSSSSTSTQFLFPSPLCSIGTVSK
jgi:predicted GIY-YIG superfamily endonuclease